MTGRRIFVGLVLAMMPGLVWAQTRGTITGTVKDPAGALQTGITVLLTTPAGIDRPAASGVDGTYVFNGLAPGEYRLRIEDTRFAPWSRDKIAVAAGDRITIEIALQPRVQPGRRGALSGTVTGPNGRPLAGAAVALSGGGPEQRVTADTAGAYAFSDLAPGTYRVRVTQPDARPFESDPVTLSAGERRLVDVHLQPLPPPPTVPVPAAAPTPPVPARPLPSSGGGPPPPPPPPPAPGLEASPDRWDFQYPNYQRYAPPQPVPFTTGGPLDPYNQNALKGDFPLSGHTFLNVNLQFNSTLNPGSVAEKDGRTSKLVYNQNLVAGMELFGGDTVFVPKTWAVRATAVINLNRQAVGSFSFGDLKANDQQRVNIGAEELFGEARLAVLSPNFDFMSIRGGMQNFNGDFRGFLFADNQAGVRFFGNSGSNRAQYNFAFFSMRDRDPVSQLHDVTKSVGQNVIVANYYLQDVATPGYTIMVNVAVNRDRRTTEDGGDLAATYVGFHGDGHWGSWSVDHAFYQAFGHDNNNVLTGPGHATINARMAAIELARDSDASRLRGSFFYASGSSASDSGKASGFDAIMDNPNFAGGQFMFWTQQAITVPTPGGRAQIIKQKFSLLPTMRNKFDDRSNFFNPGLILVNGGLDLRLSPKLKLVTNGSFLRFADPSILNALTGNSSNATIGLDLSAGFKWRPRLNENVFLVGGLALLLPRGGLAAAIGSSSALTSAFATFQIVY